MTDRVLSQSKLKNIAKKISFEKIPRCKIKISENFSFMISEEKYRFEKQHLIAMFSVY